jgi:hypothetical protein
VWNPGALTRAGGASSPEGELEISFLERRLTLVL